MRTGPIDERRDSKLREREQAGCEDEPEGRGTGNGERGTGNGEQQTGCGIYENLSRVASLCNSADVGSGLTTVPQMALRCPFSYARILPDGDMTCVPKNVL